MVFLEPFTTISATILTNIASDIVEYHAKDLENTFAGRLLKWGGLIKPDFNDHLREAIKKAFKLFFQTYEQYNLTGIESFFCDPMVTQQIGDYILNRQPIDEHKILQAFNSHLMKDAITVLLMRQRKLVPQNIIPDFLKCYRQVLNTQLSLSEMSLLLEILDQSDRMLAEIKSSEARMKDFINELLSTKLSSQALQTASHTSKKQGTLNLIQVLNTAKPIQPQDMTQTVDKRLQFFPRLFIDGLCKGQILEAAQDKYFVSHDFPLDTLADWRKTLTETLVQDNQTLGKLTPCFTDDTNIGGYRFCAICEQLYTTSFSIFLLPPSQDRNVYLELGIALGLRKPFLLIQPQEAKIPPILDGLSKYVTNGIFQTVRQELPKKIKEMKEYDFGVVHPLKDISAGGNQPKYIIAAGNLTDDENVEWSINDTIKSKYPHLKAVSFSTVTDTSSTMWMIEQLIEMIQTTRFAIYRVNEVCSPTTFLSLGISIALNKPFLMIRNSRNEVPIDLQGIGLYQFPNFVTLERTFLTQHQFFFDKHA